MKLSAHVFAGVIIAVAVVSFAAGGIIFSNGEFPTIEISGKGTGASESQIQPQASSAQQQPTGEASNELGITATAGGGFLDRYGYFVPKPSRLYLMATGLPPIDISVGGKTEKSCQSSPCSYYSDYPEGVYVYSAFSNGKTTGPKFFVIGVNTHEDVGSECRNPTLDYSKDGFVDVNDMQKLSEVIAGAVSCPGLTSANNPCDLDMNGAVAERDLILLAEKVNACFK